MTPFEITTIVLLVIIAVAVVWLIARMTYVGYHLLEIIGKTGVKNAEMISATNGNLTVIFQQLKESETTKAQDNKEIKELLKYVATRTTILMPDRDAIDNSNCTIELLKTQNNA